MLEPKNELGVIVLFAQQCVEAGFEILSIQSAFPDALVRRGDVEYRAEFEYQSSNFIQHRHDPREADLIICWQNDLPDSILPILTLSDAKWAQTNLTLPSETRRELAYWKRRALSAERRVRAECEEGKVPKYKYSCDWCGRPFTTQNARNAHLRFCKERPVPEEATK